MKISEVNDSLECIALPGDQKKAILQVIDLKINNDMKEVIAEIRQFERVMESKIQVIEDKIEMIHDKIQLVHDRLSNEIKIVYWVIGITMSIMLFMMAKK